MGPWPRRLGRRGARPWAGTLLKNTSCDKTDLTAASIGKLQFVPPCAINPILVIVHEKTWPPRTCTRENPPRRCNERGGNPPTRATSAGKLRPPRATSAGRIRLPRTFRTTQSSRNAPSSVAEIQHGKTRFSHISRIAAPPP
jgi:hypothetical protein